METRVADTEERMRFPLAIAVAVAVGALLGYYVSGERSHSATTGGRTVTVTKTKTVVRTVVRPDRRAGRRVFLAACARCHTLDPGDSTGRINLTHLRPSFGAIVEQVGDGGIAMPSFKGRLSERQIRDVAAFVTAEAARRGRKSR
jgi:cytochrome c6